MKKNLLGLVLLLAVMSGNAQVPFLKAVDYRGAFAPSPTAMWTDGWANWDPNSASYPSPTVTISSDITTNTVWTKNNTYLLQGPIFVKNGATLTIEAGTVVRGDANTAKSCLVIARGAKIYAVGTATSPIVFTSSKAANSRAKADWGGVILLGKASYNGAGGEASIEGLPPDNVNFTTKYGGGSTPDDNDNSGTLKYVRIEYGGYVFSTNNEINGLTFGAVGRGTTIDYVQCSYIDDDAFEWFGGTVNCSHLIAYRGTDDEFDTDNGFSGTVQFCLGVRDPNIGDPTYAASSSASTSEGFESDNDANGSTNTPITKAIFSNVTLVGPLRGNASSANQAAIHPAFRRSARIRRNSQLKVINSILMDYPTGLFIDGAASKANFAAGTLIVANNIFAGNVAGKVFEAGSSNTTQAVKDMWAANGNDSLVSSIGVLSDPFTSFTAPDYRPATNSPARYGASFTNLAIAPYVLVAEDQSKLILKKVDYRGAFAPAPTAMWTNGWANWDPNSASYPTPTVTISSDITTNTTWTASNTYLLQGPIFVKNGATLTIEAGTVIRGDANTAKSCLVIARGAKISAVGTSTSPIVFTSSKAANSRAKADWGGVILLGKASYNGAGGEASIEGLPPDNVTFTTKYGGGSTPDDNDNSGTLKYVRIEYGGYVFSTNNEINGLTFGAVGRGTTIDYVQCSFIDDDAFEWFGGTVNCSHLIAYRGTDDEFDTDNGFSGTVQFCLGVRDPNIGDPTYAASSSASTSEGFESDNDANGSTNTPITKAIFSNVTLVGPLRGDASAANQAAIHPAFRRSARIRRNSQLKLVNSILMDYPTGLFIDGSASKANFAAGTLIVANNIFAGNVAGKVFEAGSSNTTQAVKDMWAASGNDSLISSIGVLSDPFTSFTAPDYRPATGSIARSGASFTNSLISPSLNLEVTSSNSATVSDNSSYNDVTLTSGTLTVSAGKTLTINGTLTLNGGTLVNNGTIDYGSNVITVASGKTVSFNGTFSNDIVNSGTISLAAATTFSGNVTNNGTITGAGTYLNAAKLSLTGVGANLSGNGSIGVLEINTTGTIINNTGSDSLKILNKLILTNGVLASNGKLTIKSTSLDSTAVVDVVTNGSVSGNVVAERFIPAKFRAYRDLTPGVNTNGGTIFSNWQEGGNKTAGYGIFITGTKGTPGTTDATSGLDYTAAGSASAYSYRNGIWSAYSTATNQSTKSGALANLDYRYGYRVLVRGDRGYNIAQAGLSPYFMVNKTTLRASGTLVTGDVVYNTTNSLNPALNGYSMIGNPYLAPLDWDAVTNEPSFASSKLNSAYNFISRNDSTNNDGPTGALSFYVTYQAGLGASIEGVNAQYIMPGSAFFVQNDGTGATGSFTIKEAHKAANNSRKQYGLFSASASKSLYVSLYKNTEVGYQKADGIKLVVNKTLAANRGVNKFANAADNLSFVDGNKSYAIAGYKNLTANDTINLALSQLTEGTSYKLNLASADFNVEGLTPYLLDKNTNTTTELKSEGTNVTFTASNATRFAIVFSATKSANTTVASAITAYPNPLVGNTLHLSTSSLAAGKYSVAIYNVLGKKVFNSQIEGASRTQSLKVGSLTAGNYNVVISNTTKVVYSTVLQVK